MDSPDLKPDQEAQLEAWLRMTRASAPPPDDGFSARVMAALPAGAAPHTPASVPRAILCGVAAAAGLVVTLQQRLSWTAVTAPLHDIGGTVLRLTDETMAGTGALVLAVTLASLVVAYWSELRSWSKA
jgi:hypothetical protein